MKSKSSQQGISLVEVLVALGIGLFLIAGLIQLFISSRQAYKLQDAYSRVQENGRIALDFIMQDARNSDFLACLRGNKNTKLFIQTYPYSQNKGESFADYRNDTSINTKFKLTLGVSGVDNSTDTTVRVGTDSIIFGGINGIGIPLNEKAEDINDDLQFQDARISVAKDLSNLSIKKGNLAIIGDCNTMDIFQVTDTKFIKKGVFSVLHYPFASSSSYDLIAQIYPFYSMRYYIDKAFNYVNSNPYYSLYREAKNDLNTTGTGANKPVEIVEGIEDMQILYGEDTDADQVPNYYVPLYQLNKNLDGTYNTENVISIRINLLVASTEMNVLSGNTKLTYNNIEKSYTDGRVRREYSATIAIRNRLTDRSAK